MSTSANSPASIGPTKGAPSSHASTALHLSIRLHEMHDHGVQPAGHDTRGASESQGQPACTVEDLLRTTGEPTHMGKAARRADSARPEVLGQRIRRRPQPGDDRAGWGGGKALRDHHAVQTDAQTPEGVKSGPEIVESESSINPDRPFGRGSKVAWAGLRCRHDAGILHAWHAPLTTSRLISSAKSPSSHNATRAQSREDCAVTVSSV